MILVDANLLLYALVDAALAAIAIEHGATLCTTDRGFARFQNLSYLNPRAERLQNPEP